MNAVGIDVSKGKSTVAILRPMGEVVQTPIDVSHDAVSLERLAYQILSLGENTRVVMEATGRYHEPVATELHDHGIVVSVVNPLAIHGSFYGIAMIIPYVCLEIEHKIQIYKSSNPEYDILGISTER